MTQLEIALKLREQIKEQWPYVSTILALYENNTEGQFSERIQTMVDKLLPDEVYYGECWVNKGANIKSVTIELSYIITGSYITSLPINIVLFGSEDNPNGEL